MREILYNLLKGDSKQWKIHVLCWAIFIAYEVGSVLIIASQVAGLGSYLFFYILHITLFYTHALYILPLILERKGLLWWKIFLIVSELGIFVFLAIAINLFLVGIQIGANEGVIFDLSFFGKTVFRNIYFMLYSTGYYFLSRFLRSKKEEYEREVQVEQLRSRLLQAEIDYLRARINPHLLFNSLSFIKSAIKHSPAHANEAILLLSKILDFALQDTNRHETLLKDEVKQVENLIRLNELRLNKSMAIKLTKNIEEATISVIPIILLTLAENVFKHGLLHHHAQAAEIYVEASSTSVIYRTSNLKKNSPPLYSHGSGLRNIKLRLEKSFPHQHHFTYGMIGNRFCTEVQIMLPSSTI